MFSPSAITAQTDNVIKKRGARKWNFPRRRDEKNFEANLLYVNETIPTINNVCQQFKRKISLLSIQQFGTKEDLGTLSSFCSVFPLSAIFESRGKGSVGGGLLQANG